MGNGLEDFLTEPFAKFHPTLLMAGGAEVPAFAREGQEILVATIFAFNAGETIVEDAAIKIAVDHLFHISTEEENRVHTHPSPSDCRGWKIQFVANGPDIPDTLLQAYEEGRVVFFCGAQISYPAGLPGFKGLFDEIYRLVGTTRNPIEQDAYSRNQFDATPDLLERRLPGQRFAVRKALTKALQPKLRRKGATDTHAALLQLARNREGALRLVTTNFDRIFERVAKYTRQLVSAYPAPMLPLTAGSLLAGDSS